MLRLYCRSQRRKFIKSKNGKKCSQIKACYERSFQFCLFGCSVLILQGQLADLNKAVLETNHRSYLMGVIPTSQANSNGYSNKAEE